MKKVFKFRPQKFTINSSSRKSRRRKFFPLLIVFLIFLSCFYGRFDIVQGFVPNVAYADSVDSSELEEELQEEVSSQIEALDFDTMEEIITNLSTNAKKLFGSSSFVDKVSAIISGEYFDSSSTFFSSVASIFLEGLKGYIPIIASIIAIAILGGMVANLKPMTNGKSIGNVVHFVTYGLVIVFLGATLVQLLNTTSSTLGTVKTAFDSIFPILLTLLTAVGGTVSVGIYQPAIALLSEIITSLITYLLLPMFIFSIVFSIVGNLSSNVKLDKFVSFLQSAFKWIIGLCFTIFLGFVSIQGIMAGAVDGLSIRTAKYAIKSYIPIVGSYMSDGLSIIMASSVLIKNAVGGVGLFLLLAVMISPIINIALFMLSLKFMAGIIEPIGDHKIANFVSDIAKSLSLLIALLIAVAFMYLVMTGLIMCSANLVV